MDVEKVKVLGMCESPINEAKSTTTTKNSSYIQGSRMEMMITFMGSEYYSVVRLLKDSLLEYSTISEGSPRKILTI